MFKKLVLMFSLLTTVGASAVVDGKPDEALPVLDVEIEEIQEPGFFKKTIKNWKVMIPAVLISLVSLHSLHALARKKTYADSLDYFEVWLRGVPFLSDKFKAGWIADWKGVTYPTDAQVAGVKSTADVANALLNDGGNIATAFPFEFGKFKAATTSEAKIEAFKNLAKKIDELSVANNSFNVRCVKNSVLKADLKQYRDAAAAIKMVDLNAERNAAFDAFVKK